MFLQRSDPRLDIGALTQQAARFFRARVGAMDVRRPAEGNAPLVDLLRIAVAPHGKDAAVVRSVLVRAATESDWTLATTLESERAAGGLGALARRCALIAEVERVSETDEVALLLAAVVASAFLGPIVDESARDIFGVKTAKVRLGDLV